MPDPVTTTALAAVRRAADEMSPDTAAFAAQVSGAGRAEVGAWFADHVRLRRLKSQIKIMGRAKQLCEDAGLGPRVVKMNVLVPLLESGSLEEDESLAERWAALLANAATGSEDVEPGYTEILRQLLPAEAAMLDNLCEAQRDTPPEQWHIRAVPCEEVRATLQLPKDRFMRHVDNVYRLRVAAPGAAAHVGGENGDRYFADAGYVTMCVTPLGAAFVRACSAPTRI